MRMRTFITIKWDENLPDEKHDEIEAKINEAIKLLEGLPVTTVIDDDLSIQLTGSEPIKATVDLTQKDLQTIYEVARESKTFEDFMGVARDALTKSTEEADAIDKMTEMVLRCLMILTRLKPAAS